jgi:hypothetical protein
VLACRPSGCGGEGSSQANGNTTSDTSSLPSVESEGLVYVALGVSWPEGARCNVCRTFPQTHAEALSSILGNWHRDFDAMCDNAKQHDAVCVDVRPVLNGPDFEQPVDDGSQESMDAVAELLVKTGMSELGE